MDRVNGADWVDIGGGRRGYLDEDLPNGVVGTEVTALWLNMVQEEILKVIEQAGLVANPADWTQLWQALKILGLSGGSRARRWMAVISVTLSSAPGAPTEGDAYLVPAGATGIWAANVGKIAEWTGSSWSYMTPPDGHVVGLPDGRVYQRRAGTYVEMLASVTTAGLVKLASLADALAGLSDQIAVTPKSLKAYVASRQAQVFTASGTFVVPADVYWLRVRLWGGGGGGAGSFRGGGANGPGGGGGSGGYSEGWVAVTPGQSIPVTIGAAGSAGGVASNGGAGGTTSFGAFISATGGLGGKHAGDANAGFGGAGGTATGGELNISGGIGGGWSPWTLPAGEGGTGAAAPMGGPGGLGNYASGGAGILPGGGGAGAGGNTQISGQAGALGLCTVSW